MFVEQELPGFEPALRCRVFSSANNLGRVFKSNSMKYVIQDIIQKYPVGV